jgi:hypothetical protein
MTVKTGVSIAFSFVLFFSFKVESQTLNYYQEQVIKKQNELTPEYNSRKTQIASLLLNSESDFLNKRNLFNSEFDSLNYLLEIENEVIEKNRLQFDNYLILDSLLENSPSYTNVHCFSNTTALKFLHNRMHNKSSELIFLITHGLNAGFFAVHIYKDQKIRIEEFGYKSDEHKQLYPNNHLHKKLLRKRDFWYNKTEGLFKNRVGNTSTEISKREYLFNITNAKEAVISSERITDLKIEKANLDLIYQNLLFSYNKTKDYYLTSLNQERKNRDNDSLFLNDCKEYYFITYLKSLKDYNDHVTSNRIRFEKEVADFKIKQEKFEKEKLKFESEIRKIKANSRKNEAAVILEFKEIVKNAQLDPYSTIIESVNYTDELLSSETYPCAAMYWCEYRTKNQFGAYDGIHLAYCIAKEGEIVHWEEIEVDNFFEFAITWAFQLALYDSKWDCVTSSNISKPIEPTLPVLLDSPQYPALRSFSFKFKPRVIAEVEENQTANTGRKISCEPWIENNYFKKDYPGKEVEAVYDFLKWHTGFYPLTFDEGSFYNGQCGITNRFPFFTDLKIEENGVLREIADEISSLYTEGKIVRRKKYEIWKPTYDKKQKK